MCDLREQFKKETGNSDIYNKDGFGGSDNLDYVGWLESKLETHYNGNLSDIDPDKIYNQYIENTKRQREL